MKQKITRLLIVIFIISASACENKSEKEYLVERAEYELDTVCSFLRENLGVIGYIRNVHFLNDSEFVLTTKENVYLYNTKGEQLHIIGNRGKAINEYISPDLLYATDEYIYVWCNMLLRMNRYKKDGTFVDNYCRFKHSIEEFIIINDSILYYREANHDSNVLHKYNWETKKDSVIEDVKSNASYRVLSMKKSLKIFNFVDNNFLFANPVPQLDLMIFDSNGVLIKNSVVFDKGYEVAHFNSNEEYMSLGYQNTMEKTMQSSIINGVTKINSNYYVITETGEYIVNGNKLDPKGRNINIFKLDENLKVIHKKVYPYFMASPYVLYKDKLYLFMLNENGEYLLLSLKIND